MTGYLSPPELQWFCARHVSLELHISEASPRWVPRAPILRSRLGRHSVYCCRSVQCCQIGTWLADIEQSRRVFRGFAATARSIGTYLQSEDVFAVQLQVELPRGHLYGGGTEAAPKQQKKTPKMKKTRETTGIEALALKNCF